MTVKKFTDNQLAQLQLMLEKDYRELKEVGLSPDLIYANLEYRVRVALTTSSSSLFGLGLDQRYGFGLHSMYPNGFDPNLSYEHYKKQWEEYCMERSKPFTVLNTFVQARQHAKKKEHEPKIKFVFNITEVNLDSDSSLYYYVRPHYYCPTNNFLFNWLMLDSIMHHNTHLGSGGSRYYPGHSSSTNKDDAVNQALALLLLTALVIMVVALAAIALYYMLLETFDSVERFWHNEGWLQAAVSLASIPASSFATSLLAATLLTGPLTSLALTAGVSNPVGVAVFGIICLSIVGAGAGCFLTNKIQAELIKRYNPQALDPQDPHRFTLTGEEEQNLLEKGIDPIKAKCAIVALREQIGAKQVPYLFNRIFCSGSDKQAHLDKIRQLRRGELREVDVGLSKNKLHFDLNLVPQYLPPPPPQHQYPQPPAFGGNAFYQPVYQQQQSPIPPPSYDSYNGSSSTYSPMYY